MADNKNSSSNGCLGIGCGCFSIIIVIILIISFFSKLLIEQDEYYYDFGVSHAYFNISDEYISEEGRTWNHDYYPECNSLQNNYYAMNGKLLRYDEFIQYVSANAVNGNEIDVAVQDYSQEAYDLNEIVRSTGYVGTWKWSLGLNPDVSGYQVIRIVFQ